MSDDEDFMAAGGGDSDFDDAEALDDEDFDVDVPEKPKSKKKSSKESTPAKKKSKVAAATSATPQKSKAQAVKTPTPSKKAGAGAGGPTPKVSAKSKPKAKAPKTKEKDAHGIILNYLNKQNKPYSVVNIYDNLHHSITRPVCQRVLDGLSSSGKIRCKVYGKSKLYFPDQSQYGEITPESLRALDEEYDSSSKKLAELKATQSKLTTKHRQLTSALTDEQLDAALALKEKHVKAKQATLEKLQSTIVAPVSPEARRTLEEQIAVYVKEWKTRRRIVLDFIDLVAGDEGNPKNLMKRMEVETDKEAKVNLTTFLSPKK